MDVFLGYLVLDALVANSDRHPRNWSILRPPAGEQASDVLCPLYDNGSAFGLSLSDDQRLSHLRDRASAVAWAEKGHAQAWSDSAGQRLSLVALVHQFWQAASAPAQEYWVTGIRALTPDAVEALLDGLPDMSVASRRFAVEIVRLNQERILRACLA